MASAVHGRKERASVLLFCDSFDHYVTANLLEKYLSAGNASILLGGGRVGSCLQIPTPLQTGGSVSKGFSNKSQLIVGFAFNPAVLSNEPIVQFIDSTTTPPTVQGALKINASGGLEYHTYPGGNDTTIAVSANGILAANTFQYIEVNVAFETSATGSVSAQLNGQNVFTVTGVVTSSSGNNFANSVTLTNGPFNGTQYLFDDFYVCDSTGTVNNNFLGDVSIQALLPNGAGQSTQFTPHGLSQNWQCVSQNPPNTADYVSDSTPGHVDLYMIQSISGSPTAVVAVQIVASAEKDDSNSRVLGIGFGNGTISVFDAGFSLTSSYLMYNQPYDLNPITNQAWAVSDVNSGQIGIKVIS